jgi:hypothetical protein
MIDFDQSRTWEALEQRLEKTDSPRQRQLLQTVIAHGKAETVRDLDGLMATLVPDPQYHFWSGGEDRGPKGYAGVVEYYKNFVADGGAVLQSPKERIFVDDDGVVHEGVITTIVSGRIARRRGYAIDDDRAHYAVRARVTILWSFDDNGLAYGEDSYSSTNPHDFEKIPSSELPKVYLDYLAEIGQPV